MGLFALARKLATLLQCSNVMARRDVRLETWS